MKKFVIFTLIIAMAAGAAFAQTANGISINAWGRGAFVPLGVVSAPQEAGKTVESKVEVGGTPASGGDYYLDPKTGDVMQNPSEPAVAGTFVDGPGTTSYAGVGASWGWSTVRTDFRVNGNADFVGFQFQWTEGGLDGQQHIWAKPFSNDILKLTVGRFEVDNLRGKITTDTGFENFVLNPMDEDKIFNRFKTADSGFLLSSEPMDGLFIGLKVEGALGGWIEEDHPVNGKLGSGSKLLDTYRFLQLGFGYDIADIGHIRAQWVGGWFGTYDPKTVDEDMAKDKYDIGPGDPARLEVAFALTAVQNLLVDLGGKFWLPVEEKDGVKKSNGVDVNVGARYRMDAFQIVGQIGVNGLGGYSRGKDSKQTNGFGGLDFDDKKGTIEYKPGLAVNLIPTYDLEAFTIGASLGMTMAAGPGKDDDGKAPEADEKYSWTQFGFGAFVSKGLGSGSVKAGLAYTTAPIIKTNEADFSGAYGSGVFSIPIILEYAFF